MPRAVPATPLPPSSARATGKSPGGADRRPVHIVMFAVIACGLLVAAAFVVDLPGKARDAGSVHDVEIEPASYALQATGNVSRLAALPALPATDLAALAGTEGSAARQLQAAIDEALATLEATLADAALPAVPDDYVPGAEVEVRLPPVQPYALPALPTSGLGVGGLQLPSVTAAPSPVGPRAGTPADDVLAQLEGLQAQIEDLLGGSPLQGLPVEGLPVPVGGLPLGGSPPGQVQDAGDAVDPDEEGAVLASLHAQDVLGLATGAYATTSGDLAELLALYEGLAQQVQDAIDQVRALQTGATDDIAALLEERLAAIEDEVAQVESEAAGLVRLHARAVADAQHAATDAITEAVDGQSAALAAAGHATIQDLERQASAIEADAQQRKADIQAIVDGAIADLGDSTEATQALQAVQASAAAATLKIERDAKAQVAALQQQVDDVRAQVATSQARLQALAGGALDELNGTVEDALATDDLVHDYLVAVAQTQGALLQAREADLAAEAVADLAALADGRVEDLVAQGLEATQVAEDVLDEASGLVGGVEDLLVGEVSKDLDYVVKVSEDYGRVPTDDRKARATHWSALATGLGSTLQDAVLDGRAIEALAGDVLAAAGQAEAEIAALG